MKNPKIFFFATLLTLTGLSSAQSAPSPQDSKAWCDKDKRPEIAAYCDDLDELRLAVLAHPTEVKAILDDSRSHPENLSDNLDKLSALLAGSLTKVDLQDQKSVTHFVTAVGPTVAGIAAISDALGAAGQSRPDKQLGAGSSSGGTTTLVSKAGSAELLALALDTGALTRSVNGTTTTLSANADQLFRLVTGSNPDCTVTVGSCQSRGWFESQILNPTTVSARLDVAQQSSQVVATSGQASGSPPAPVDSAAVPTGVGRLSGITARYQLRNGFDPRSDKFKAAWKTAIVQIAPSAKAVGDDTDSVRNILVKPSTDLDNHQKKALVEAVVEDPSGGKLKVAFETYWMSVFKRAMADPKLGPAVSKVMQDRAVYREAWFRALDQAVGTMFTFEYDYNRPFNQPYTHDLKLIYGYDFGIRGMVTLNGTVSLYSTIQSDAKYGRLHYGQVSAQYDRNLSGNHKPLQTQLSLAGYWQYQPHPSILNIPAGTVVPGTTIPLPNGTQEFVGTAGSLWVTQAKLTIKGSKGINIPIGVSWSNKTDLLQGSKVGAQIGISYDFSSITGLFTGTQ